MFLKELLFNIPLKVQFQNVIGRRYFFSKSKDIIESTDEKPMYLEQKEEKENLEMQAKRNKSRLNPEHRNILFGQKPYNEPIAYFHNTVKYKKRVLGRYGIKALGVPAGVVWPTPKEVEDAKEYERVAFPLTIQERLKNIKDDKRRKEEIIMARQQDLEIKMATMDKVIAEVREKVAKKEALILEAKQKREEKIAKIRADLIKEGHISAGKIDEALAEAEKREKKKKKEAKLARRLEKQKAFIEKLLQQNTEADEKDVENEKSN